MMLDQELFFIFWYNNFKPISLYNRIYLPMLIYLWSNCLVRENASQKF